jgi:hypothetical protein
MILILPKQMKTLSINLNQKSIIQWFQNNQELKKVEVED